MNIEITPKDLPNTTFWKLTNEKEVHHSFKYKTGLNVDTISFNPTGECQEGGLYFFSYEQLIIFSFYCDNITYIRKVSFDDDTRIYVEEDKYKANKFILDERQEFYLPKEICLGAVKQDGYNIRYVKEQTPELCLEAVKQNGWSLQFIKEKTNEICLIALEKDGYVIQFVNEQTEELCLKAVKQDGYALECVKEQTLKICLEATKQDKRAIQFVDKPFYDTCLIAIEYSNCSPQYTEKQKLLSETISTYPIN